MRGDIIVLCKRVLIVIGAAVNNRGSEALLTGLSQICKKAGAEYLAASSADLKFGAKLKIPLIDESIPRYKDIYHHLLIKRVLSIIRKRIGFPGLLTRISCGPLLKRVNGFDLIIVIGADNFDGKATYKREIFSLAEIIKKMTKAKVFLFDCSIDKRNINERLIADLKCFDAISARDTTSFQNLKAETNRNNLYLFPDPAFIMTGEQVDLGIEFIDNQMVGLNVSNKVAGKIGSKRYKLVFNSYCRLIEYITLKIDLKVLLIPHVMKNADLSVLKKLYDKYRDTKKVFLVDNEHLNARQLKYLISKCRYFVGARTHATIAAYSSCVPTLVLGYSIKSVGIARDLFGTEKNYVIPVSSLKTENDLLEGFKWLRENEEMVRNNLKELMPKYVNDVWKVTDLIKKLLEN